MIERITRLLHWLPSYIQYALQYSIFSVLAFEFLTYSRTDTFSNCIYISSLHYINIQALLIVLKRVNSNVIVSFPLQNVHNTKLQSTHAARSVLEPSFFFLLSINLRWRRRQRWRHLSVKIQFTGRTPPHSEEQKRWIATGSLVSAVRYSYCKSGSSFETVRSGERGTALRRAILPQLSCPRNGTEHDLLALAMASRCYPRCEWDSTAPCILIECIR